MAEGIRNICGVCGTAIMAWSDGNPYYLDVHGQKVYAYHPDHKRLDMCIGNDSPHLCLACKAEFMVDSKLPLTCCPQCNSTDIADIYELNGKLCPFCKVGLFAIDTDFQCIS